MLRKLFKIFEICIINYDFYRMRKLFLQTNTSRTLNKKWGLWHIHVMRRILTLLTGMSLALYHGSTVRIIWLSRALQSESGYLSVHSVIELFCIHYMWWPNIGVCVEIPQQRIHIFNKLWKHSCPIKRMQSTTPPPKFNGMH